MHLVQIIIGKHQKREQLKFNTLLIDTIFFFPKSWKVGWNEKRKIKFYLNLWQQNSIFLPHEPSHIHTTTCLPQQSKVPSSILALLFHPFLFICVFFLHSTSIYIYPIHNIQSLPLIMPFHICLIIMISSPLTSFIIGVMPFHI